MSMTPSPFDQTAALYCRTVSGCLIEVFGRLSSTIKRAWKVHLEAQILGAIDIPFQASNDNLLSAIKHYVLPHCEQLSNIVGQGETITHIYEYQHPGEKQIRGMLVFQPVSYPKKQEKFLNWFIQITLTTSRLEACDIQAVEDEKAMILASAITELFSVHLRNIATGDMWDVGGGRDFFYHRVLFYVARALPVEAVLPAFPCKSSCLDKVSGVVPDKGEELALRSIHRFVEVVKECYSPGVKVYIVSDGHVFSDCIGVDDQVVDTYGSQLVDMRNALFGPSSAHTIPFVRLPTLFHLSNPPPPTLPMPIHIHTLHTPEADTCRQLLAATCMPPATSLRGKIASDPPTLALYRGFSRFMLEDLSTHPSLSQVSKSQRKKTATKVAFEMLLRNQAYSNLVEMVFPSHVRFSIHAHRNDGPKFGIALLTHAKCRVVVDLLAEMASADGGSDKKDSSDDLLHIPTPWHNSIVRIPGRSGYLVVKRRAVLQAVATGACVAEWVAGDNGLQAGYTLITPAAGTEVDVAVGSVWGFFVKGVYGLWDGWGGGGSGGGDGGVW